MIYEGATTLTFPTLHIATEKNFKILKILIFMVYFHNEHFIGQTKIFVIPAKTF